MGRACAIAFALLLTALVGALGAPHQAAAQTQDGLTNSPVDPPLEATGPIAADQYSAAYRSCSQGPAPADQGEHCAREELDRQTRRLDAAFHQSLVVAADDDQRSLIQGRQAAWISMSNDRCFGDLRKGDAASRVRGLTCLISAAVQRRLMIEHEDGARQQTLP